MSRKKSLIDIPLVLATLSRHFDSSYDESGFFTITHNGVTRKFGSGNGSWAPMIELPAGSCYVNANTSHQLIFMIKQSILGDI